MKRLREEGNGEENTIWLPHNVRRRIARLVLLLRAQDGWLDFLDAMRQNSIVVPSLGLTTVPVWQCNDTWLPDPVIVVDRILSLQWQSYSNTIVIWCVNAFMRELRPSSASRDRDAGYTWCIVRHLNAGGLLSDTSYLADKQWFVIGTRGALREPSGLLALSPSWLAHGGGTTKRTEVAVTESWFDRWYSAACDWFRCRVDDAATTTPSAWLPADVWNTIWRLVLLSRYQARWLDMCDAARQRNVVPHHAHPVELALYDDHATTHHRGHRVHVCIALIRLVWDDVGPFALVGRFFSFDMMTLRPHVPHTELMCFYYGPKEANGDVVAHTHRYWPCDVTMPAPVKYLLDRPPDSKCLGVFTPCRQLLDDVAIMRAEALM